MIKRILASIFVLSLVLSPLAYSASTATCNDTDCKSANHFDGADAATSTTDSSASAPTWTFVNQAQLDTAQFKFGSASLLLDGTGDSITTPDSVNYTLGSGDFTIECWVRLNTLLAANRHVMGQFDGADTNTLSFEIYFDVDEDPNASVYTGTTRKGVDGTTSATTGAWYHVAWVRSGNTGTLYLNGTSEGTVDLTGVTVNDSASVFQIGDIGSIGNTWDGWVDESRFVLGTAVFTGNFTAPSAAYSDTCSTPRPSTIFI